MVWKRSMLDGSRPPCDNEYNPTDEELYAEIQRLKELGFKDGDLHGLVTRGHREALTMLVDLSVRPLQGMTQGVGAGNFSAKSRRRCRDWDSMCAIARKASIAAVATMLCKLRADIAASKAKSQSVNGAPTTGNVVYGASGSEQGRAGDEHEHYSSGGGTSTS